MPSDYSLTVTVLPHLLALVHIPRSRLVEFSHQVVKQILSPSSPFLNITCNKLELSVSALCFIPSFSPKYLLFSSSLFADHAILADFEPLARRDRRRYKRALSAHRSHTTRPRQPSFSVPDPVQVSYDTWNVLQLDSHNDRLGPSLVLFSFSNLTPLWQTTQVPESENCQPLSPKQAYQSYTNLPTLRTSFSYVCSTPLSSHDWLISW